MKKYLIYICMLWGIVISCNDDDNLPKISPKDSGEWTIVEITPLTDGFVWEI